jgi:hypothetical protein
MCRLLTIVLFVTLAAMASRGSSPTAEQHVRASEYEVYAGFLLSEQKRLGPSPREFVVRDETLDATSDDVPIEKTMHALGEGCEDVSDDVLYAFRALRPTQSPLDATRFPGISVRLIARDEFDTLFSGDLDRSWASFYARYPTSNGLYSFSRVAFSRAGDEAVMYVSHSCGGHCGVGKYVALKKQKGFWQPVCTHSEWVS